MEKEEKLSKFLYKLFIVLLKFIPIFLVLVYLSNTIISYIGFEDTILNYVSHFSIIAFMLLASKVFKFCKWHRSCIYYITIVDIINIYDTYIGIPVSNINYMFLHIIVFGVFLCIILKQKFYDCKS